MKTKILFCVLFFWIVSSHSLSAQQSADENQLLWKTTENNTVLLKWYGTEIYTKEAINIYRKSFGGDDTAWVKLNTQSVTMLNEVPDALPNSEEKLYEKAIKDGVDAEAQDIFNLLTLLKSFESTPFAQFLGVYYEDNTAIAGQAYQYKITLIQNNGKEADFALSTKIDLANPITFEPPQNIEVEGVNDKVNFKWQIESERYYGADIFRSEEQNGTFELINDRPILISSVEKEGGTMGYPDIFFTDDSLQLGKTYYYYLTARGFFADSSQRSEVFEILVKDEIPPIPVRGLEAIRLDSQALDVKLTWKPSSDFDIKGYYVQRKVTGDFKTVSPIIPANQSTYTDKVPKSSSYLYRILSVDNSDNEAVCEDIIFNVIDYTPPHAPRNLTTRGEEGAIILDWDDNTDEDIMGYFVFRIESNYRDREMLLLDADFITGSSFIDSLPRIAKNTFVYRVTAIDSSYNIGPKSDFSEAKMPDVTPPIKPIINSSSPPTSFPSTSTTSNNSTS